MTDKQLKRLAGQCMCHPASIDTIEQAGEAISDLMKQRDDLIAALERIAAGAGGCYAEWAAQAIAKAKE